MNVRVLVAAVAAGVGVLSAGLANSAVAQADPPYASCKDAAKDGRYNIPKGDPAYAPKLDRDGDGIACES